MRLFVALDLPPAERDHVYAAAAVLRDRALPVRWVEPDALHLTLKFLGEVDADRLDRLRDGVAAVAARHAPFPLQLAGAGAFPGPRRPAVWWIGVPSLEELTSLQQDIEATLAPLGFPTEQRPFTPHLTLGRTRRDARAIPDAEPLLRSIALRRTFTVRTLDLMRSHLSPRGARYEPLLRARLAT